MTRERFLTHRSLVKLQTQTDDLMFKVWDGSKYSKQFDCYQTFGKLRAEVWGLMEFYVCWISISTYIREAFKQSTKRLHAGIYANIHIQCFSAYFLLYNCFQLISLLVKTHLNISYNIPWHIGTLFQRPAGGRGASVSACADLTNQLLSCWVDPRMCLEKTLTQ